MNRLKYIFSFEKTHQVSNLTDTLTEEPTDDIDVSFKLFSVDQYFRIVDKMFAQYPEK